VGVHKSLDAVKILILSLIDNNFLPCGSGCMLLGQPSASVVTLGRVFGEVHVIQDYHLIMQRLGTRGQTGDQLQLVDHMSCPPLRRRLVPGCEHGVSDLIQNVPRTLGTISDGRQTWHDKYKSKFRLNLRRDSAQTIANINL